MTAHSTVMHNKTPSAQGSVEEVRAGVDWISCSLPTEARNREAWLYEAYNCLAELADEGHLVQNFGLMGYRGLKVGGSFVGKRDDSVYCQLAGVAAATIAAWSARSDCRCAGVAASCSARACSCFNSRA